jgi:hypothetical protein
MARAYRKTVEELESANSDLWKTIRTEQVDDLLVPYFLADYEEPLLRIQELELRLGLIQSDIEDFVSIVGSHSRREIALELRRCKLEIARSKRQARSIWKRTIQENDVQNLDVVQAAFAKRDRIIAKLTPIMAGLERKLTDAEEILKKYA